MLEMGLFITYYCKEKLLVVEMCLITTCILQKIPEGFFQIIFDFVRIITFSRIFLTQRTLRTLFFTKTPVCQLLR